MGVHLAGGGTFGNPGDNPLTDNGDGTWSITMTLAEGISSLLHLHQRRCKHAAGIVRRTSLVCLVATLQTSMTVTLDNITQDTTFNFCFGECGTDGVCVGDDGGGGDDPTGPTDNAADPTLECE